MKNYKIISATQKNQQEFQNESQISLSVDKLGISNKTKIIYENKIGLPKLYNSFITDEYKDYFLLFVHDDVLIEDLFFEEKVFLAFEKYDIIGLAGAKKCNLNSQMSAWHMMCNRSDMVGEVSHSKNKTYWTSVFGPTDSRALVIDGLFIGVNVERLLETNTRFDESFDFHHYDISFCLQSNENKLKIGVFPLKVTHFGLGDSMLSEQWKKSDIIFKQKYCGL
jgi:hypothetical protein